MKLELQRKTDGTGLMIFVVGKSRTLAIPLAQGLSEEIGKMIREEAIPPFDPARSVELARVRGGR